MAYEKQIWNQYDALKTEEENIENGAVVTDNRMNHIEEGIEAHTADLKNPHKVTAAQVGLGDVQNFGLATQDEAKQGTSNAKYMTPSLTQAVLSANINSIAYANSADGTDGFTTIYPNLNLLTGTKDFSGSNWTNLALWQNDGTYKGLTVKSTQSNAQGLFQRLTVSEDGDYVFSIYVSATNGLKPILVIGKNGVALPTSPISSSPSDMTRISYLAKGLKSGDVMTARLEGDGSGKVSVAGYKWEKNSTATPYMPSASEVTTADWPKYIGFSNTAKTNKSASNYTWFPVKDSELTNKVESHINNKSNPHSVTASQVGAYSKIEADSKLALKANDSEVVHKTGDETIAGNKSFTNPISCPRSKTSLVSSNMSGVSIYKDGNSVSIRLVGALTSAVSNGNLIGSIPTGYIPDADWHFYCFGAGQMYRVLVRADGGLQASQDIPSGTAFRDTINYII